jgi:uncharacterized protein involved in oxidation of intracellular sulfur
MKLGIILTSSDAETVFNALRLALFSLQQGDTVQVFLSGKSVEIGSITDSRFNVPAQAKAVLDAGGRFLACGSCLKLRASEGSELCPVSSLKDQYEIVRDADRVLTF